MPELRPSVGSRSSRPSLDEVVWRYDRLARHCRSLEPLFLITAGVRRRAVKALALQRGDVVLEIGAGTGRNLPHLLEAVGREGAVVAVDASLGMLEQARKLAERRGWPNVAFLAQDAEQLQLGHDVDAVLFSLSYSVIPEPRAAVARAWQRLRPGGRLVVMDAGIPASGVGRLFGPVARALVRLAPGDPHSDPWPDLRGYGELQTERFRLGLYYTCVLVKPPQDAD